MKLLRLLRPAFKRYRVYVLDRQQTATAPAAKADLRVERVSANNVNSAQLFSAGGMDFIHLNLECNAPDDVLAWADALLTRHSSHHALITTHMDLGIIEEYEGK